MTELSENAVFRQEEKISIPAEFNNNNYILNYKNLSSYEASSIQALRHVCDTFSQNKKVFNGKLAHMLSDSIQSVDLEKPLFNMKHALEEVSYLYLNNAVYFQNPKYVAHLNCPIAYPSVVAEQILTAINSSLDTYDQSGAGTLIEQKLIDWTAEKIGFDENADGVFTSGGSQSNLMALLLARDNYSATHLGHSIRERGITEQCQRFKVFASSVSHFSVQKSAAILGLGYEAVISIPVDDKFKMDIDALNQAIDETLKAGDIPICVVGTAGTTDFGSVDPLNEISAVCKQHKMWFHADAAYGCGLLVSPKHKAKLAGISKADSVTVDYHKSFLQPVSSSAFFVEDKRHLSLLTHHSDYLNPLQNDTEKTPNLVDKSLQTTRRFDALKLWLTLRVMGADKIGHIFDTVIDLASKVHKQLSNDEEFEVIHSPEISTVVFRYVNEKYSDEQLNKLNYSIKEQCFSVGNCAVARTKYKGVQYLKFTLLNPDTKFEDILEILSEIKSHAYLIRSYDKYTD
ncbi:pyridoxal-dependent decarboxylase [Veronia nyctiphanis]|uniref:Pyridoxal-dependent decarboxylase n=1 Tax=Veronia nyctiphanis TaxID=1278244 RepID=A0A4Q0YT91_9GAMM|nr:aspartate aminotransferase family protein [Veronia nyctiphanis]RXJ73923.1 pyridoxal-dependent decarboxylase [Veronia nyctiphanis]